MHSRVHSMIFPSKSTTLSRINGENIVNSALQSLSFTKAIVNEEIFQFGTASTETSAASEDCVTPIMIVFPCAFPLAPVSTSNMNLLRASKCPTGRVGNNGRRSTLERR